MPLYEYACRECSHRFEVLQRMGEGAEGLLCPSCGAEKPQKQLSTFSGTVTGGGSVAAGPLSSGGCGSGGFT